MMRLCELFKFIYGSIWSVKKNLFAKLFIRKFKKDNLEKRITQKLNFKIELGLFFIHFFNFLSPFEKQKN